MVTSLKSSGITNKSTDKTSDNESPSLFLQELSPLSLLIVAITFTNLRNDVKGSSCPVTAYILGIPWTEVDPTKLSTKENMKAFGNKHLAPWLYWLGMNRKPKARTIYNEARPMPVI